MPESIDAAYSDINRPEDRLLICCARTQLCHHTSVHIRDLLRNPLDWDYLIRKAAAHCILPLLYLNLRSLSPGDIPQHRLNILRIGFLNNAVQNHFLTGKLIELLQLLEGQGIPAVPLKGPALAAFAYGDVSFRQFGDLDILIHKRDAVTVYDTLCSSGYSMDFKFSPGWGTVLVKYLKHFSLTSTTSGIVLEPHWTLEYGTQWAHFSDVAVWKRLGAMYLDDHEMRSLSLEDLLFYLCVHGAKHCWGRLLWICDIAELLNRFANVDWEALVERASKLRRKRMLFLGIRLANNLLGANVPKQILRQSREFPMVEKLSAFVRNRVLGGPNGSAEPVSAFSFQLLSRESKIDRISFVLRPLIVPQLADFQSLRLPPSLSPLYYLIRPVRLVRKHFLGQVRAMFRKIWETRSASRV